VSAPLISLVVNRILEAVATGADAAELSAEELGAVLPDAPCPTTFELHLTPSREPRGARPGTGWLLGVHAPAGASWGRFAHALGQPLTDALAALAAAEKEARPDLVTLDVAYAPSRELADLAVHPPVRARTLELLGGTAGSAIGPSELELVAGDEPSAAMLRAAGDAVEPSPLSRLRSTTAPPGLYRLLSGWSLYRQHAAWSFDAGPLGGLDYLPRIVVDGFVVAPASWRIPADLKTRRQIQRWRARLGVPETVQLGHEDQLLWVDLAKTADAGSVAAFVRAARSAERAYEVWPPVARRRAHGLDAAGRRVEVIAAVVASPAVAEAADDPAGRLAATVAAPSVPSPARCPADPTVRTFKLFGAPDRQDRVLAECVRPALGAADIAGWFFVRYLEGRRHHLRVRVRARRSGEPTLERFERALREYLEAARRAGDLVIMEQAPYHPEVGRYGDALPALERLWQADSELVCDLLTTRVDGAVPDDRLELQVCAFESLAGALGLEPGARLAVATARTLSYARGLSPKAAREREDRLAADYRVRQARLRELLEVGPAPAFARFRARAHEAAAPLGVGQRRLHLPDLLHLSSVRLCGAFREDEVRALYLWRRALEGLTARARRTRPQT
jgi:thiopeptide-type bacteriocin biosynthesis protein